VQDAFHGGRGARLAFVLTVAFSAKESFYKATSAAVGRIFDFGALRLVECTQDGMMIGAELTETLAPTLREGMRFVLRCRRMANIRSSQAAYGDLPAKVALRTYRIEGFDYINLTRLGERDRRRPARFRPGSASHRSTCPGGR
jgi:4'-phosphopantetheinyl transferase superfamily